MIRKVETVIIFFLGAAFGFFIVNKAINIGCQLEKNVQPLDPVLQLAVATILLGVGTLLFYFCIGKVITRALLPISISLLTISLLIFPHYSHVLGPGTHFAVVTLMMVVLLINGTLCGDCTRTRRYLLFRFLLIFTCFSIAVACIILSPESRLWQIIPALGVMLPCVIYGVRFRQLDVMSKTGVRS